MSTMKAVQFHNYGGPDVLVYEEARRPEPGPGEVLIKVMATSVNPFDCAVRAGYMSGWYKYALPHIPGLDIAGVIEELGAGVEKFSEGTVAYARADPGRGGAYAEYVVVDAELVARKPVNIDYTQAAAIPHVLLTAWAGLYAGGELAEGQRVLVHGAAGGVGHMAVQLAKLRGAYVIGTASARNLDFVRGLGADEVIDYTATPFEQVVSNVDVVLDTIGGETQDRSWGVLKPGGILLSTIQAPSADKAAEYKVRQSMVFAAMQTAPVLTQAAQLVDSGRLRVEVSTVLPLSEASRGHELNETKHTRGKIALQVQ